MPDDHLGYLASAAWLRRQGHYGRNSMKVNSLHTLALAVAHGVGIGILPCYLADTDPAWQG